MFTKSILLNSITFNLAWLGCIVLGNQFSFLVLVWAAIHLFYSSSFKTEFVFIVLITLIGFLVDSGLLHLGVLVFSGYTTIIPFWLTMLWLAFAMTLNGCLAPLQKYPLLQCIVGAFFPAFSYLTGGALGAVSFSYSPVQTALIISVLWAGLLPLFFYLNHLIKRFMNYENTANVH